MALAGLHVAAGYVGSVSNRSSTLSLAGPVNWSETLAVAGTTTKTVPNIRDGAVEPVLYVNAAADSFVVIGPNPDINTGARHFVKAGIEKPIYCQAGDKLAWVAA